MKNLLILISSVLCITAQSISKSARPLTRMPQSAMAASLGDASSLLQAHSASFFNNPATLVGLHRDMINFGVQNLSLDRKIYLLSIYTKIKNDVFLSFGFVQAKVDELYEFDSEGIKGSSINFTDNMFYVSGGFKIMKKLAMGISVNYLFDNISTASYNDYNSNTIGLDIGLTYDIGRMTTLAFVAKNLNRKIETNSDKEENFGVIHEEYVPKTYTFGIRSGFLNRYVRSIGIDIFADYKMNEYFPTTAHYGVEIKARSIPLRIGMNDGDLTYGFGFRFRLFSQSVSMNYGYVPSISNEGNSHLFDWSILF